MNSRIILSLIFLPLFFFTSCEEQEQQEESLHFEEKDVEAKIDSLLSVMTVEEKVGQMLNIGLGAILKGEFFSEKDSIIFDTAKVNRLLIKYGVGSVQNYGRIPLTPDEWRYIVGYIQDVAKNKTRLGIPVLYGIDAIHGANYTKGSVMFPHQINMAASFNTEAAKEIAAVTAYEMKAGGVPWNYSPVLDVTRHPMWGRIYESFGEDTYLASQMGEAMVLGMQGTDPSKPTKVIACAKHFVGYGAAYNGKDRSPIMLPERTIRQVLLPPFKKAIDSGLLSIMVSSSSLNGIPSHSDHNLLTNILKKELNFKGILITDWGDIDNLYTVHQVAADEREAVKMSILAGVDICMEPYDESFAVHLLDLIEAGEVPMSRIDDAVKRILYVKHKAGIFENPLFDDFTYTNFASKESDSLSHSAACESITLLKNIDDFLPLKKNKKILLTGVSAHSINYLNGGWSRSWSGQITKFNDLDKLTILDAIEEKIGSNNVIYSEGTDYTEEINIDKTVRLAAGVDYIVVCVGEKPATEKPSDINEIDLPEAQQKLVKALAKTGKPIVMVMVQGRPRIIREIEPLTKSILMAFLPGNEGGRAIADVLYGDENPSGKLPYTYPRYSGSLWTYDHPLSDERDVTFGLDGFTPQYEFGYGLSYTNIEYSGLRLSADSMSVSEDLGVEVRLKNLGKRSGKEAVLLFVSDEVATVSPAVKQLKRFKKIEVDMAEETHVTFTLNAKDFEFVGLENKWVFEPGYFTIRVGTESRRVYLY